MNCVETRDLSHRFSANEQVLNNINLAVPQGAIYGFLGPNGAGKTTTLRLLLGLLKKQTGSIHIFNKPFEKHRVEILSKLGSLIESPSLYGHLTARDNLLILQKIYQCPKSRIDEVLHIVGLSHTGKKKTGRFSLGMKQRLSIAMALLHNPGLLVLDEPTNGLDPNGILEIRELLKKLNAEKGVTIVISSHLLSEIEKLVTHLGIIHKGNLLYQGTFEGLYAQQANNNVIRIETNHSQKATDLLKEFDLRIRNNNGFLEIPVVNKELIARINAHLVKNQVEVYQITTVKNDLESIFMELVKS